MGKLVPSPMVTSSVAAVRLHPNRLAKASLRQAAPGLIGQMIFREIWYMPRYQQLYTASRKPRPLRHGTVTSAGVVY
ncbi:hypothetical protein ACFCWG_43355 [Streptomyces sp. NPDC056390]|uniref:hypothetical protein n=1 Tax=Streptomyces sp. NPDC056390 TaxID=3345806 RepID=UPI0035DD456F